MNKNCPQDRHFYFRNVSIYSNYWFLDVIFWYDILAQMLLMCVPKGPFPHINKHCPMFSYRVLHTLDVTADNSLTGDFRLARPHWNNMARLICNAKFHNALQMYGWVICFKSIAHGSKCPIELSLPIDAGRKFSWLMKTCSEFPLHLRDAANEVIQIAHVHM